MSRIDLNRVWDDARAMGAANKDLLGAIAGMFVLLPGVIAEQLMAPPPETSRDTPMQVVFEQMMQSYADNWPILLGHGLVTGFGSLAMLVLLLRPERLTVAESLKAALILLPGYFIAYVAQGVAVGIGLALFLLPGFYLLARLSLIGPVAAAEHVTNPFELIRRSISLTAGNGVRIFLMLAVLFCTAGIVALVLSTLAGLVGEILLPKDVAKLVLSIVSGLVAAALAAFTALVGAAIYRAATAPVATPWQPLP